MTKIMLVEDDNNLREIYEARLKAEGFDIVSAADGEAALALAAQEHPDLIITDVMMPKISGFEMLDILRNTEGLRNVKVIMLTALGQAEDNARAKGLGADRYLVKSQVTLEDIIKAAHDVIDGENQASNQTVAAMTGSTPTTESVTPATSTEPVAEPPVQPPETTAPVPAAADLPVAEPPAEVTAAASETVTEAAPTADSEENTMRGQIDQFLHGAEQITDAPVPPPPAADDTTPPANAAAPASDDAAALTDPVSPPTDDDGTGVSDDSAPAPAESSIPKPPEEGPDEIAQDDAAPDMGQFAVHPGDTPLADVPENTTPAESPTSQPPVPGELPTPDQAEDDKVVSSAINDMLATTGTGETSGTVGEDVADGSAPSIHKTTAGLSPVQPGYSDGLPSEDKPAGGIPSGQSDAPDATGQALHGGGSNLSSRVLQPLTSEKPDINQLLSVEEAKNSAVAASVAQVGIDPDRPVSPPPPPQPPSAPDGPHQPPGPGAPKAPGSGLDGVDPHSIAL